MSRSTYATSRAPALPAGLLARAQVQGGVFSAADAAAAGIPSTTLERLCRRGAVVRVRRGAFVLGPGYAAAARDERFVLEAKAILRTRPDDAASHHTALALWRVPLWGHDLRRIDVVSRVTRVRHRSGVVAHPPPAGAGFGCVGAYRAVDLAVALAQVAADGRHEAAVVAIDAAVHARLTDAQRLSAAWSRLPPRLRCAGLRALEHHDPACESVAESRTRLILRLLPEAVRTQVGLRDVNGIIGRVDFLVGESVIVEFDGLVKYAGASGRQALAAEKLRESRLTDLGYVVVRVVWAELDDPAALLERVRVALTRARSWGGEPS